MFVRYMELAVAGKDNISVTHSVPKTETEHVIVWFDQPDSIFFLKEARIDLNDLVILYREGFTDEEMAGLIEFCRSNKKSILHYARIGGVANA